MDGNKDDGEKCLRIAESKLKSGDIETALKYLNKAERLYPTNRAKELLAHIKRMNESNGSAASGPTDDAADCGASAEEQPFNYTGRGETDESAASNGTRHRHRTASPGRAGAAAAPEPKYTADQIEAVKKIHKCKDYYEILGVSKDCSDEDLKKAYRKLALKFHPDKNQAPGATDAFKAIGNAMAVLSNPTKRKQYDSYGDTGSSSNHHHQHHNRYGHSEYDYTRGFEGDMSAEDLFRMFFGGGFAAPMRQHSNVNTRRQQTRQDPENPYAFLLQLSPLILMIILSLLSALFIGESAYSFQRDQKYYVARKTRHWSVQYYVKDDFLRQYVGDAAVNKIEQQVESDYLDSLQQNCYRERTHRENTMWRARMYNNPSLYEQAKNMKTPSCDTWRTLQQG